ncbi:MULTISPECIES: ABC transporter ATP-binding protein [unclassified Lentimonas]|uniref:ABC transporter ATP-binding protein n=1 Tax=unclassified Lentimonas TaxID=2630993 RepID=UPI0013214479|nr:MULTISPECIES: ABC transporter ATP-binding protein [unclassified Lentimonas]CAA6696889.1 ABC transporter, ATP-binding protein [Lentimonas sp. CC19]CAA6697462.1 ABC transporter, ATP-binding protein [Lentimonas sp. CC10]CAA7071157.1 ABC transporter, ATP-binding protein [Lentimonas sp. CC11]
MQTPASNLPAIEISGLSKTYPSGESELTVLTAIDFSLSVGESLAIVGPSGSGKTTLLGLCAGLDLPTAGSIRLLGEALEDLDEDARARLRGEQIGFVFQNFQLIPTLTALENVSVPIDLLGGRDAEAKAKRLLDKVGLGARMDHYPIQLSGGEQQRVALARAFINEPKILFADEPTGNLDGANGGTIEELLFDLNHELGTTLVLVTHDPRLAAKCDRILSLRDGRIVESEQSATV